MKSKKHSWQVKTNIVKKQKLSNTVKLLGPLSSSEEERVWQSW